MSKQKKFKVNDLHKSHPKIRAQDWRSPLVRRLLTTKSYRDGDCDVSESHRSPLGKCEEQNLSLEWTELRDDFNQVIKTYQEPVITEYATLGLACILVSKQIGLEITEVTRRSEKADYWLGNREFLLEVSGQQSGNLETLCLSKAGQLQANPFNKSGYVCVANYETRSARLWYYDAKKKV
jgi:hypothetical protein